jgi:hypothetical protein
MATNVPNDVIEELEKMSQDLASAGINGFGNRINDAVSKLRAQRQQGAEPVAWKYCPECGCFEFVKTGFSRGSFCKNCGQEWFEDIDYSGVVAGNLNRLFSPTPPQANALVAAAYRKAAEILEGCKNRASSLHQREEFEEAIARLKSTIPADAEAALRERDFELCMKAVTKMRGMFLHSPIGDSRLKAIVNSVLASSDRNDSEENQG